MCGAIEGVQILCPGSPGHHPLLRIGNDLVSDAGVDILGGWDPLRHHLPPSIAVFPQDPETKAEYGTLPITGGNRPTRVCGQAVDRAAHPATQLQI